VKLWILQLHKIVIFTAKKPQLHHLHSAYDLEKLDVELNT